MTTFEKFKKAIIEMYKDGELDKILKHCKRSERKAVKNDIKVIEVFVEFYESHNKDLNSFSIMPLLMQLESVEVYKDALAYMLKYDEKKEA